MGWLDGSASKGYSKAISNNPDLARDFDFGKEVMKPRQVAPGERIIEGATAESIQQFAESRQDPASEQEAPSGPLAWLRRLFR